MCLELEDFVFYTSCHYYYYDKKLEYSCFYSTEFEAEYCKKHNLPMSNEFSSSLNDTLKKELRQKIDNIVQIATLLRYYNLYNEYTPEIKRMKILIVSIPTFNFVFSILPFILDDMEPFSGIEIYPVQAVNDTLEEIYKRREYG
jgi:hypothetical protein